MSDSSLLQVLRTGGFPIAVELKRRVLLREVNARIREVSDRFGTPDGSYRLLCECGEEGCSERLDVPVAGYDELRLRNGFLVCAAHEPPSPAASLTVMAALVPAEPVALQ